MTEKEFVSIFEKKAQAEVNKLKDGVEKQLLILSIYDDNGKTIDLSYRLFNTDGRKGEIAKVMKKFKWNSIEPTIAGTHMYYNGKPVASFNVLPVTNDTKLILWTD